jgi:hypothetical protein
VLTWTGTAAASNNPDTYDWQVDFADSVNGTPVSAVVGITIRDLAPTHSIANASGGTGSTGTPYSAQFIQGNTGANSVDLANVNDPNTTQPLNIVSTTPGVGNPAGGSGLGFSLAAGLLTVTPNGTLVDADRGTHDFDVQVTDGANPVTISVRVEVIGIAPTFTSTPVTSATPGSLYTYTAIASGTPAPTLSLTSILPSWLTFNPATGELTGTPGNSNAKTSATVTITADNGVPPLATQTFTIDVARSPDATSKSSSDSGGCEASTQQPFALLLIAALGVLCVPIVLRRRA